MFQSGPSKQAAIVLVMIVGYVIRCDEARSTNCFNILESLMHPYLVVFFLVRWKDVWGLITKYKMFICLWTAENAEQYVFY